MKPIKGPPLRGIRRKSWHRGLNLTSQIFELTSQAFCRFKNPGPTCSVLSRTTVVLNQIWQMALPPTKYSGCIPWDSHVDVNTGLQKKNALNVGLLRQQYRHVE